jgi:hypothetical protein
MGNIFTDLFSTKPAEEAAKAKAEGFANAKTDANAALDTGWHRLRRSTIRPMATSARSPGSSARGRTPTTTPPASTARTD